MNEEQIAAAFYGSSTGGTTADSTPAQEVQQSATPAAPENPYVLPVKDTPADSSALELVRGDPMRKMYSDEAQHGGLYDAMFATPDGLDSVPKDIALVEGVDRAEFAAIVTDHGASHADVREFLQDYREFSEAKLTDTDKQLFLADAIQGMKEKYGDGWEGAWDAANALAKRDPRIAKMLVESGLGADRKTVLRFAEEALRQRTDGRLK